MNLFIFVFFQYILNDRISYPDETFMDMEFKISVMYDIAKVLFVAKVCFSGCVIYSNTILFFSFSSFFYGVPNRKI